jgi:hypothetical protein
MCDTHTHTHTHTLVFLGFKKKEVIIYSNIDKTRETYIKWNKIKHGKANTVISLMYRIKNVELTQAESWMVVAKYWCAGKMGRCCSKSTKDEYIPWSIVQHGNTINLKCSYAINKIMVIIWGHGYIN